MGHMGPRPCDGVGGRCLMCARWEHPLAHAWLVVVPDAESA